jgi:hypothetical protein
MLTDEFEVVLFMTPVSSPVVEIEAIEALVLVQLPPKGVADKVAVNPGQRAGGAELITGSALTVATVVT